MRARIHRVLPSPATCHRISPTNYICGPAIWLWTCLCRYESIQLPRPPACSYFPAVVPGGGSLSLRWLSCGGGSLSVVVHYRPMFAPGGGSLSVVVRYRPGCSLLAVVSGGGSLSRRWFSCGGGSLSGVVRYRPGCSLPAVVLSRRLFALGGGSLPAGVVRSRWWFSLGGGLLWAGLFAPGGGSLPAVVRFRRWFALGGGSLSAVVLSRPGCSLSEVVRSRWWFGWFTLRPYLRWSPPGPPNRQRQYIVAFLVHT